ncbi:MAG: helix-turn-helix transcriptional regulator [Bacilli bacterium]|nr:helix-turn-helix transcriptional regulator [Bacilli bacterium]
MNLGEKIVKIRKDNEMSQDDLAEILNVARQTVSNWENSKNYPDIETLIELSDKFHISLDVLLKGDKEMVYKMDKKMKNAKIFKTVTLVLLLILLFVSVIFGLNYRMKKEKERKVEQKYNTLMKNIDKLGFEKDGIGFAFIKEDGIIYRVFIKKPLSENNEISANTITFSDEEAISVDYDGKIAKVTYLNENKTTVYCDQFGNLFNEAQNKNSIEIYDKYQDRTISIVTRMVELFDNIYR